MACFAQLISHRRSWKIIFILRSCTLVTTSSHTSPHTSSREANRWPDKEIQGNVTLSIHIPSQHDRQGNGKEVFFRLPTMRTEYGFLVMVLGSAVGSFPALKVGPFSTILSLSQFVVPYRQPSPILSRQVTKRSGGLAPDNQAWTHQCSLGALSLEGELRGQEIWHFLFIYSYRSPWTLPMDHRLSCVTLRAATSILKL